jgi:phage recombination protein Bet
MNETNTALATIQEGSVDYLMSMASTPKNQIRREMDRNYLTLLKNSNPNLADIYFIDFIHKCQITGADPRLNQIYLITHKAFNKDLQQQEFKGTVIFAYLFFIQMAQKTGQLEDWGVECIDDTYVDIASGRKRASFTSTCWVKRKGQAKVTYTAYLWELAKQYNGALSSTWASAPKLMLNKCAVANAFRWAFPETLGSFYIQDEIKDTVDVEFTPIPMKSEQERLAVKTVAQEYITPENVEKTDETFEPERDIEDYRSELLEFIGSSGQEFFDKLGKDRQYMLDKIEATKNIHSMKTIYDVVKAV